MTLSEKVKFHPFMVNVPNRVETSELVDNADQ